MDLPEWDPWSIDFNSGSFQNETIFPDLDAIPSFDWPTDDLFSAGMYSGFQPSQELLEMETLPPGNVETTWQLDRNANVIEEQSTLQNHELHTCANHDAPQQESAFEGRCLPLEEQQLEGQGASTLSTTVREDRAAKGKKAVSKERQGQGDLLPGVFWFQVNSDGPTLQQKARYSSEQKKNIREIRYLKACLRCQNLKKKVRHSIICDSLTLNRSSAPRRRLATNASGLGIQIEICKHSGHGWTAYARL